MSITKLIEKRLIISVQKIKYIDIYNNLVGLDCTKQQKLYTDIFYYENAIVTPA